jgi:hypothetical protein
LIEPSGETIHKLSPDIYPIHFPSGDHLNRLGLPLVHSAPFLSISVNFLSPLPSTLAIHKEAYPSVFLAINATAFDFTTLAVGYGGMVGKGIEV